jgi:hypothetical protein
MTLRSTSPFNGALLKMFCTKQLVQKQMEVVERILRMQRVLGIIIPITRSNDGNDNDDTANI